MSLLGEIGVGVGSWVIQEIVEDILEEDEAVLHQNSAVPEVFVPPEKGIKSIHVRYEGAGVADAYYEILVDGDVVRSGHTDDSGDVPSFVADPGTYHVTVAKEIEGGYYYGETDFEIVVGEHFHNTLNVVFVPSPTPPDDIEEKLDEIKEEVRTIEDGMYHIRPILDDVPPMLDEIKAEVRVIEEEGLRRGDLGVVSTLIEEIHECACAERPEVLPRCEGDPNDTRSTCFMQVWVVWREWPGGGSNDGRADLLEPTEGVLYRIDGVFYDHSHRHREAFHAFSITNPSGAWEDAWPGYESMFEDFIRVLLFERAQKGISQTQLIHGITQFYQWVTTFNESDPFSPHPLIHFLPELPRELLFIGIPGEDEITHQMLLEKLLEMEGQLIEVEKTPWWAWVSLVGFLITLGGSIGLAYKKK